MGKNASFSSKGQLVYCPFLTNCGDVKCITINNIHESCEKRVNESNEKYASKPEIVPKRYREKLLTGQTYGTEGVYIFLEFAGNALPYNKSTTVPRRYSL